MKKMKRTIQRLFSYTRMSTLHNTIPLLLFVMAFASIGTYLLVASHAATPTTTASIEAEQGSIAGNACKDNDNSASGSGYVQFGTTTCSGAGSLSLPHDPNFIGPSYYTKFSNGPNPTGDPSYFPNYLWDVNLSQWTQSSCSGGCTTWLSKQIVNSSINGIDDEYSYKTATQSNLNIAASNGLGYFVNVCSPNSTPTTWATSCTLPTWNSNSQVIKAWTMQDEPDSDPTRAYYANNPPQCSAGTAGSPTPWIGGTPDACSGKYQKDANLIRAADSSRPIFGTLTKDVMDWASPPTGWSEAQRQQHIGTILNSLDIENTDNFGWTDSYEWSQATRAGTGHYGAWIYGHAIEQLHNYNNKILAYGTIEYANAEGTNCNTMMPGMIDSAVWDTLVHGGRGIVWWGWDMWDNPQSPAICNNVNPKNSSGGYTADTADNRYPGASYNQTFAGLSDHQWDSQADMVSRKNAEIKANAVALNSPTVTGISATASDGTPMATLGKDVSGKLWLVAMADGNTSNPLSNTAPMTATITVPSVVPTGTVLTVVGENRTVMVNANHQFTDSFGTTTEQPMYVPGTPSITYGYAHHIYSM